jgi:predicted transcriptional regulator
MSVLWSKGEATVQETKDALDPTRGLAYTTVMTVMGRLVEKGLLSRRKVGRSYAYTPVLSREKLGGTILNRLVRRIYAGATGTAIAHLIEGDETVDEAELERLEKLIRAKREERRQ